MSGFSRFSLLLFWAVLFHAGRFAAAQMMPERQDVALAYTTKATDTAQISLRILGFDNSCAQKGHEMDNLIEDISGLSNCGLAIGVANYNLTGVGDVLSVSAGKPLSIRGNQIGKNFRTDLAPQGSETNLKVVYNRPWVKGIEGTLNAVYRHDADNVSGADDAAAMYHFRIRF